MSFKYYGKIKSYENELPADLPLMLTEVLQVEEQRYQMGI